MVCAVCAPTVRCSFRGELLHGGHPITAGTRYIIVAFLYAFEGDEPEKLAGETQPGNSG